MGSPVHNLNTGLNYTTIQEAIDANETLNGDTIEVDSGIYYESINVNKSLTLVGENEDTTILDGNGTGVLIDWIHAIIALNANDISIMNLTIRNAGLNNVLAGHLDACVSCIGERDIDLENNLLQKAGGGILCSQGASSIIINNNTISDIAGLAIDVGGATNPTATNITISNNLICNVTELGGINLDGDITNCTIFNNTVENSSPWGIGLGPNMDSLVPPENVTVSDNFVTNCSFGGIGIFGGICNSSFVNNTVAHCNTGIWLGSERNTHIAPFDNLIDGNILSNNNYTNLVYGRQTDIGDIQDIYTNVFRRNNLTNVQSFNLQVWGWNVATFMQDIDSSNIANNEKIYYLTNLSNVEVDPSNLPGAGSLALVNCSDVTVKDFNFSENNDGLLLAGSTRCTLTNVTLANNQLYLVNKVWGPVYGGLALVYSTNNTITDSRIYNNTCGVWICWSNGNTFYDNAFVDNDQQAINGMSFPLTSSSCNWNNTVEGNYWSDYNGTDANRDGIGDTPYIIDTNNIDHYPLMGHFESFNVSTWSHPNDGFEEVDVISNFTISNLGLYEWLTTPNQYLQAGQLFLRLIPSQGQNMTAGFCRMTLPNNILNASNYTVLIDMTPIIVNKVAISNGTHTTLYFTFNTSAIEETIIVPEFPSLLILPLFMIATLFAIIIFKKKGMRTSQSQTQP